MQLAVFDQTRAVCMLRGLTGNIDKNGGDVIPQPIPIRNIQCKDHVPGEVKSITCDYPLFNDFHATWGRHAQSCLIDAILDKKPYPVKMLVVQSANPAVTMTDSNRVIQALNHLDFIVAIDLFMTKTASLADVVLPAAGCFEKTQLNRAYFRNNFIMLQEQVIECIADSRPDWEIIFKLARKIGLEKEFPWRTAEEAIDYQLAPTGITVEMLRENPDGIRIGETEYEKYKREGFATPSGKLEFYSKKLKDHGHPPVPSFENNARNSISFHDQKEEYPMLGISGSRSKPFTHTQFRRIPPLVKHEPEARIDIHPDDARAKKILSGDTLCVETPKGRITMKAKVTDIVHPGSIRIGWGWGEVDSRYNLNNLTDDGKRNAVTCTPSGRSFMCRVTKLE